MSHQNTETPFIINDNSYSHLLLIAGEAQREAAGPELCDLKLHYVSQSK